MYQSIIVHMSALFWWNTTDYSPHDMHCINDTVILIRADKLGGQLAPVLPPVLALPTCKPAAAARNSHDPRYNQCALLSTGGPPPPSNRATTLKRSKQICSHLMRHRELLNFVGQFMNWPISIIYPYACKGLKRRSTRSNADGKHFINRLTLLPEERCWSVRVLCSSRLDVNL